MVVVVVVAAAVTVLVAVVVYLSKQNLAIYFWGFADCTGN
jgi:hypothetical protein